MSYIKKLNLSESGFERIWGKELPIVINQICRFVTNSSINDIKNTYGGDLIIFVINKKVYKVVNGDKLMEIIVRE